MRRKGPEKMSAVPVQHSRPQPRHPRPRLLALAGLIFLLTPYVSLLSDVSARTLIDQAGELRKIPDNPRRIVALAPSVAEMIFILGRGDRLVAATQYSNHPPAARTLPRVGSYARLDVERVASFGPDLCLAIKDGNPRHLVRKIEALGIPVFAINPRSLTGIMEAIEQLGVVVNAEEKAAGIVADMRKRISAVRRRVAETHDRPRVFFQIDASPIVAAGTETFIHELIETAGGINTTKGSVAYPRLSWEEVLALRPEVAVITSMAGGMSPETLLAAWRRWPRISAVARGRVHVVDADLFDRPTPRILDGLETLLEIIHPRRTREETTP